MMQIKQRYDDSVLFECEAESIKECLEQGVVRGADLSGANLSDANLYGANLYDEKLTKAPISILNLCWDVLITTKYMTIGCQRHTHEAWTKFDDGEIKEMHEKASKFWNENKGWLLAACKAHRESNDE